MIGKNIYKMRKKKGLTLSELADRAQISKSYLSNIERNVNQNPSIYIVEKIAHVLEMDLRALLGSKPVNPLSSEYDLIEFAKELKGLGIEKEELETYKTVIEFAKWKQESAGREK